MPSPRSTPSTAVLLMAYGSPRTLEDIAPFLQDIHHGTPPSAEMVEKFHQRYIAIGGASPLLEQTLAQATALERVLNTLSDDGEYRVFVGMRHWHPTIQETMREIIDGGFTRLLALCMTPYASQASTSLYFEQLDRALSTTRSPSTLDVVRIPSWNRETGFIQALVQTTEQALAHFPPAVRDSTPVIFTAHSIPMPLIAQGDPYKDQIEEIAGQVATRCAFSRDRWRVCYQCAGRGKDPWLGPSLKSAIDELANHEVKQVLIAPIGFICDHLEVLYDLDIEARQQAQRFGMQFERADVVKTTPLFIEALATTILQRCRTRRFSKTTH